MVWRVVSARLEPLLAEALLRLLEVLLALLLLELLRLLRRVEALLLLAEALEGGHGCGASAACAVLLFLCAALWRRGGSRWLGECVVSLLAVGAVRQGAVFTVCAIEEQ